MFFIVYFGAYCLLFIVRLLTVGRGEEERPGGEDTGVVRRGGVEPRATHCHHRAPLRARAPRLVQRRPLSSGSPYSHHQGGARGSGVAVLAPPGFQGRRTRPPCRAFGAPVVQSSFPPKVDFWSKNPTEAETRGGRRPRLNVAREQARDERVQLLGVRVQGSGFRVYYRSGRNGRRRRTPHLAIEEVSGHERSLAQCAGLQRCRALQQREPHPLRYR